MSKIILSLTVINSRLDILSQIIQSILVQKTLPNIIHIFYSNKGTFNIEQAIDEDKILNVKLHLINYIKNNKINVELIFTNTINIGSFNKLIPALKTIQQ